MKHLSFAFLTALTLGVALLPSLAHADGWVDKGYVESPGSHEVYTSFPDPQQQSAWCSTTSAFAKTQNFGDEAHATIACTKTFELVGELNTVYKSIREWAAVRGSATIFLSPYMPPTNPTSDAEVYLMSFSLIRTQSYSATDGRDVGIPLRDQYKIVRSLSFYVQAKDRSAEAGANGAIEQF